MFRMIRLFRESAPCVPFLLFAAIACRAEASGPVAAGNVDPCALLTKAEIQEAVGKPVQEGKLNTKANPAVGQPCEYVVDSYGAFSVLVRTAGPGETAEKIMSEMKKRNMKCADAPGIGDRSFYVFPGYGMLQLNSFKGSNYVIMTLLIPGETEDAQKIPAEKLMKKLLPRL
jgi:hypothetical protein